MSRPELVARGPDGREVARVPLGGDAVTIGRADGNTIVLADTLASRFHARVERSGDGHAVVDRGSKNGTLVNGETAKRHALSDGDEILIGDTRLSYEAAAVEAPVPVPSPPEPESTPEPEDETCAEPAHAALARAPAGAAEGDDGGPAVTVLYERPGSPVIPAADLAASQDDLERTPAGAEPLPPPGTLDGLALFAESLASLPHELGSLEEVARRLLSLVECERATVMIVEEGTAKPLIQYSRSTMLVESGGGPADEVIQSALTTERPVCIRVPRAREVLSATLNAKRHLMLVPVRASGRKLGLVALERDPEESAFEDEELALVRAASAQVATLLRSVL